MGQNRTSRASAHAHSFPAAAGFPGPQLGAEGRSRRGPAPYAPSVEHAGSGSPRKPIAEAVGSPPPGSALQHPGSTTPARSRRPLGRAGSAREDAPGSSPLAPAQFLVVAGDAHLAQARSARIAGAVLAADWRRATCFLAAEAQTFPPAGFSRNQLNRPGGRLGPLLGGASPHPIGRRGFGFRGDFGCGLRHRERRGLRGETCVDSVPGLTSASLKLVSRRQTLGSCGATGSQFPPPSLARRFPRSSLIRTAHRTVSLPTKSIESRRRPK